MGEITPYSSTYSWGGNEPCYSTVWIEPVSDQSLKMWGRWMDPATYRDLFSRAVKASWEAVKEAVVVKRSQIEFRTWTPLFDPRWSSGRWRSTT